MFVAPCSSALACTTPRLGRGAKGLLSDEDAEFYRRLRAADIHGMYVPDLAMYHYIPCEAPYTQISSQLVLLERALRVAPDKVTKEDTAYFSW